MKSVPHMTRVRGSVDLLATNTSDGHNFHFMYDDGCRAWYSYQSKLICIHGYFGGLEDLGSSIDHICVVGDLRVAMECPSILRWVDMVPMYSVYLVYFNYRQSLSWHAYKIAPLVRMMI